MFFLLFGLLLLIVSIVIFLCQPDLSINRHTTLAEVVDIQVRKQRGRHAATTYTYTLQFLTHKSEVKRWKARNRRQKYDMGEHVPIFYRSRSADIGAFLHFSNYRGLPLYVAGWGVICLEIGSYPFVASHLLHTFLNTLFLVEIVAWTAGLVFVGQGLAFAASHFRWLANGIEVTAVISSSRGRGRTSLARTDRGCVPFITQNGEKSYYSIPWPYEGTSGKNLTLLYNPTNPTKAIGKTLVRPLRQLSIKGGSGVLLCLMGVLLAVSRSLSLSQALFGAFFCLAGLWIFLRFGIIGFIDNWHADVAQIPYPMIPSLLLEIAGENHTDTPVQPSIPQARIAANSPEKRPVSFGQTLATLYPLVSLKGLFRRALLKSQRQLQITAGIGALLCSLGIFTCMNVFSLGRLLEVILAIILIEITSTLIVRGMPQ